MAKGGNSPNGNVVAALVEEQQLWSMLDRDEPFKGPTFYSPGSLPTPPLTMC
jgi:hypothetical protein